MYYWVFEVYKDGSMRIFRPAQDSIASDENVLYRLLATSHNEAVSKMVLFCLNASMRIDWGKPVEQQFNDDKPERW